VVEGRFYDLLNLGTILVILMGGFWVQLDEVPMQSHLNIINFII
jgi:hypothetical protein